ncbi:isoprenylcysteine carboxylmethyltransferase family protein [Methanotrichaceae archaeon M04Ac]|uniref:Isoprenylcysteine carboxylmethyltransferase family protein n=1 Tax=Candidatus Methanocrinis alkalitolerans TaxID=3033395 RepID=A0ABT5XGM4_9EURY|nr:isoprenylcysteine carboxylmethyltransferase family protein [Candidatus Methanocrinis alkalitolerans]MDF0593781.1 isoprenylcysteine carboxylmethyltransferase family protein [Candidatus Methanocrinis alkalitolerans]
MFTISTLILAFYLIAFALLHSLLAGSWAKGRARRAFGPGGMRWYRLFFTIIAAATLLPLLYLFYLFPGQVLYSVPAPWRWGMVAVQAAAAFALAKTLLEAGPLRFLGIRPGSGEGNGQLIVRGIYCRTRNPLFLFALVFLWLTPVMTANLLVLYIITTVYFILGSVHEERMLAEEFGAAYLDYQDRVPRFIPRMRCTYPETEVKARGKAAGPGGGVPGSPPGSESGSESRSSSEPELKS